MNGSTCDAKKKKRGGTLITTAAAFTRTLFAGLIFPPSQSIFTRLQIAAFSTAMPIDCGEETQGTQKRV